MDNQPEGNRFHLTVKVFLPFVVTSLGHRAFHESDVLASVVIVEIGVLDLLVVSLTDREQVWAFRLVLGLVLRLVFRWFHFEFLGQPLCESFWL